MGEEADQQTYHHGDLRSALLAAAEAELVETGVGGFSLRACARRAGVSHAAPKHHFGNADGLLNRLAAVGFTRLTEMMQRQMQSAASPFDRLVASGCGYVAFAVENPALFKLMFSGRGKKQADEQLDAAGASAFEVLRQSVAETANGQSSGLIMTDITAAWSIVHGLSHLLIEGSPALAALTQERPLQVVIAEVVRRTLSHRER